MAPKIRRVPPTDDEKKLIMQSILNNNFAVGITIATSLYLFLAPIGILLIISSCKCFIEESFLTQV